MILKGRVTHKDSKPGNISTCMFYVTDIAQSPKYSADHGLRKLVKLEYRVNLCKAPLVLDDKPIARCKLLFSCVKNEWRQIAVIIWPASVLFKQRSGSDCEADTMSQSGVWTKEI